MSEHDMEALSLYELNNLVATSIRLTMPDEYWVVAELSEVREVRGHCYMELVEKDEHSRTPIAKASAKCWRNVWMLLRSSFERHTGQSLCPGMKVMLSVHADFHEAYGFSWIVTDINPEYTLGDMARRRAEIIAQLKAEGIFELQKELCIPMFAQRIAVISSANAAGFGDFCNQLKTNDYGFQYEVSLFAAVMQGENVEASIIAALNEIYAQCDNFDVVVIIRGGGATSDMSGFDTLSLAENVANFPLPVITGIGHERDECVLDLVANQRVKTPTAAAALLIDNLLRVKHQLDYMEKTIHLGCSRQLNYEQVRLLRMMEKLPLMCRTALADQLVRLKMLSVQMNMGSKMLLSKQLQKIGNVESQLKYSSLHYTQNERLRLATIEQKLQTLDPRNLLKSGYSLTLHHGKVVRQCSQLQEGDEIETRLSDGTIYSTVIKHSEETK